ncbi:MAG: PilZ domain-containing protein [Planctomycetota bacterium]
MSDSNRRAALDEKRSFPRVSANCHLAWRAMDEAGQLERLAEKNDAVMNNISGGGICFTNPVEVERGRMLALEVELPGFPMAVISMGKVVWCRPSSERSGAFDVGVEFWWIGWKDEEAQNQIRRFITDSLRRDG